MIWDLATKTYDIELCLLFSKRHSSYAYNLHFRNGRSKPVLLKVIQRRGGIVEAGFISIRENIWADMLSLPSNFFTRDILIL
jgi:hypothetical protein